MQPREPVSHRRPHALQQRISSSSGWLLLAGLCLAGCSATATQDRAEPAPNAAPSTFTAASATEQAAGSTVSDPSFELSFSAQPVQVGVPALAKIELRSKAPFKCNDKYPYKFKPALAQGVSYPTELIRTDAASITHDQVTLSVPFTASAAGPHTLRGTFSFSVCTDEQCRIEKRDLSLVIQAL